MSPSAIMLTLQTKPLDSKLASLLKWYMIAHAGGRLPDSFSYSVKTQILTAAPLFVARWIRRIR